MDKIHYFNADDIPLLDSRIDELLLEACNKYGLNIEDYNARVSIKHLTLNGLFLYIKDNLFKPPYGINLINNQSSLIDYNDMVLLSFLCDKYMSICTYFSKSLGIYSFASFTGIYYEILGDWLEDREGLNPERRRLLSKVADYNRQSLISNLKESNIGQIAVANNDKETGLEWSKNNAPKVEKQNVFFIPSERVDRLKISRGDNNEV